MTKKLAELFNLPNPPDDDAESSEIFNNSDGPKPNSNLDSAQAITSDALTNLEKIEAALPQVRGLEASDTEMDHYAGLAESSYKDLMDLGMQVDSRFSSEIFAVAGTMLGHAITAKTAKINKKIKMLELQLKTQALLQKQTEKEKEIDAIPLGEGKTFDRNELLKMLTDRTQSKSVGK